MKQLLLLLGIVTLVSCSDTPNPCMMSEKYVKETLAFPDEAEMSFLDCHTQDKGEGVYRVLRKIKAKNAFGMSKTYIYEIILQYKGGIDVDENNWELISIRSEIATE